MIIGRAEPPPVKAVSDALARARPRTLLELQAVVWRTFVKERPRWSAEAQVDGAFSMIKTFKLEGSIHG